MQVVYLLVRVAMFNFLGRDFWVKESESGGGRDYFESEN